MPRVEDGNYEYRVVLRCRAQARTYFLQLRSDVRVKLQLLNSKHGNYTHTHTYTHIHTYTHTHTHTYTHTYTQYTHIHTHTHTHIHTVHTHTYTHTHSTHTHIDKLLNYWSKLDKMQTV